MQNKNPSTRENPKINKEEEHSEVNISHIFKMFVLFLETNGGGKKVCS